MGADWRGRRDVVRRGEAGRRMSRFGTTRQARQREDWMGAEWYGAPPQGSAGQAWHGAVGRRTARQGKATQGRQGEE